MAHGLKGGGSCGRQARAILLDVGESSELPHTLLLSATENCFQMKTHVCARPTQRDGDEAGKQAAPPLHTHTHTHTHVCVCCVTSPRPVCLLWSDEKTCTCGAAAEARCRW